MNRAPAKEVLVIKLGAFGDIILSDGAMRDIRAHHHGARVTVLTQQRFKDFFQRSPWVDAIMIDPRASWLRLDLLWRLRATLRAGRFDRVYDLQNNRRTSLYYRWLPGEWSGTKKGCSHPVPLENVKKVPVLDRLAAQLRAAGVDPVHTARPDLDWMCDDPADLMRDLRLAPGFMLLIPGSSARHPQKRWPHYARLARCLLDEGHQVALVLGPDELEFARAIPGTPLLRNGKPLDLYALAGVMRHAALAIGNDTGPTHIAAHLGIPGIALFGPYHAPELTCLDRFFDIIKVDELSALTAESVHEKARAKLEAGP